MDETGTSESNPLESAESPVMDESVAGDRGNRIRTAVWAVLSIAFLGFLAFGSVDARIWRFGQLHIESKSIRGVWRAQAQSLPDGSNGWLLHVLFYGSVFVFIVCVILGMRYLLLEASGETSAIEPDRS